MAKTATVSTSVVGMRRLFERLGPIAEARRKIGEAEDDGLDRKQGDENFQEARDRRAAPAAISGDQREGAEKLQRDVAGFPADCEGKNSEKRDGHCQNFHLDLMLRKFLRTPDAIRSKNLGGK